MARNLTFQRLMGASGGHGSTPAALCTRARGARRCVATAAAASLAPHNNRPILDHETWWKLRGSPLNAQYVKLEDAELQSYARAGLQVNLHAVPLLAPTGLKLTGLDDQPGSLARRQALLLSSVGLDRLKMPHSSSACSCTSSSACSCTSSSGGGGDGGGGSSSSSGSSSNMEQRLEEIGGDGEVLVVNSLLAAADGPSEAVLWVSSYNPNVPKGTHDTRIDVVVVRQQQPCGAALHGGSFPLPSSGVLYCDVKSTVVYRKDMFEVPFRVSMRAWWLAKRLHERPSDGTYAIIRVTGSGYLHKCQVLYSLLDIYGLFEQGLLEAVSAGVCTETERGGTRYVHTPIWFNARQGPGRQGVYLRLTTAGVHLLKMQL